MKLQLSQVCEIDNSDYIQVNTVIAVIIINYVN